MINVSNDGKVTNILYPQILTECVINMPMEGYPRNVYDKHGRLVWIETEPGLMFSPPLYGERPLQVSEEFRRYAELSQAGSLVRYLVIALRQLREDIRTVVNSGRVREQ